MEKRKLKTIYVRNKTLSSFKEATSMDNPALAATITTHTAIDP